MIVEFSTVESRRAAVLQVNASHAIEGFKPDAGDLAMQAAYVAGLVDVGLLMVYARACALLVQFPPFPPAAMPRLSRVAA